MAENYESVGIDYAYVIFCDYLATESTVGIGLIFIENM